jgi:hypothetical protein
VLEQGGMGPADTAQSAALPAWRHQPWKVAVAEPTRARQLVELNPQRRARPLAAALERSMVLAVSPRDLLAVAVAVARQIA